MFSRTVNITLTIQKGYEFPSQYRYRCVANLSSSGEEFRTTKKKGPDPVWDEKFNFMCKGDEIISFNVLKFSSLGKKEFFGSATVPISELSSSGEHLINLDVKGVDTLQSGYLAIQYSFTQSTLQRRASAPFFPVSLSPPMQKPSLMNSMNESPSKVHVQFPEGNDHYVGSPLKAKHKLHSSVSQFSKVDRDNFMAEVAPTRSPPTSIPIPTPPSPKIPTYPTRHSFTDRTSGFFPQSESQTDTIEYSNLFKFPNRSHSGNSKALRLEANERTYHRPKSGDLAMPFEKALDELIKNSEKPSSPNSSPQKRHRKKRSTPKSPSPRATKMIEGTIFEEFSRMKEDYEIFKLQQHFKEIQLNEKISSLQQDIAVLKALVVQLSGNTTTIHSNNGSPRIVSDKTQNPFNVADDIR